MDSSAKPLVAKLEFVPRKPNPGEPTLIWKMSQTREMFKRHRLWPSFVGAKVDTNSSHQQHGSSKAALGLLPVVIWTEQEAYLKENGYDMTKSEGISISDINKSTGKRKRDEGDEASTGAALSSDVSKAEVAKINDTFDELPYKKVRTNDTSSGGLVSAAGALIWSFFTTPIKYFGDMLPKKKLTAAEVQLSIFRECNRLGYFIGPGDVYGGDYNIYRGGDPSNSHSTATIKVCRKKSITGRDLLSFSRVQNQVAKSAVLAFVDSKTNSPQFLVANFRNVSERV
eukprot:GSChrysophyteH1.ASY1.ANO1.978.1 assembled CDS